METETTKLAAPAHPMPGWLAVLVLPKEQAQEEPQEPRIIKVEEIATFLLGPEPRPTGMSAGLVVEIGATEEDAPANIEHILSALAPFKQGAKVYFREDRGFPIGDYTYLTLKSIIAWES